MWNPLRTIVILVELRSATGARSSQLSSIRFPFLKSTLSSSAKSWRFSLTLHYNLLVQILYAPFLLIEWDNIIFYLFLT